MTTGQEASEPQWMGFGLEEPVGLHPVLTVLLRKDPMLGHLLSSRNAR